MITDPSERLPKSERSTALGIPCPWSGDEDDPITWRYRAWYQLYRRTRVLRHWFGLHDWEYPPVYKGGSSCSWCGLTRNVPPK